VRFTDAKVFVLVTLLAAVFGGCATPGAREVAPGKPAVPAKVESPVPAPARQAYEQALASMEAGRYKEAETVLLELTRKYPELAGPYANLGILYYRTARPTEAVEMLNKAIRINPQQAAYYNQLGVIQRSAGRFAEARTAYSRALEVDANYSFAHLNLGILYDLYLGEPDRAVAHYQRYGALNPADAKQVEKWIADLKQRTQKPTKSSKKEPE
jgi:Flp pilus assembly protein TadD